MFLNHLNGGIVTVRFIEISPHRMQIFADSRRYF